MILQIHSNASYLSVLKARSRAVGFFSLSNNPAQSNQADLNRTIYVLCKIIKSIVGSAAESKIVVAYLNSYEVIPMRNTFQELGHKQPATLMQVDNTTAASFTHKQIKK